MLGEPEEELVAVARLTERLTQGGGEGAEHLDRGAGRLGVPVARPPGRLVDQWDGVLGRSGVPRGLLLAATQRGDVGVPVRATAPAAIPAPPSPKETTTTCRERIAPSVVRLLAAHPGWPGAVRDEDDLAVAVEVAQRALDELRG